MILNKLMGKLKELGICLVPLNIEKNGYYVAASKMIVVNEKLSEDELIEVVLHELKHIMEHSEYSALYNSSFVYHSKMEYEANRHMISELINSNDGYFNYSEVMEEYSLNLGWENTLYSRTI